VAVREHHPVLGKVRRVHFLKQLVGIWPKQKHPARVTAFQSCALRRHSVQRERAVNHLEIGHEDGLAEVRLSVFALIDLCRLVAVGFRIQNRRVQHPVLGVFLLITPHVGGRHSCDHGGGFGFERLLVVSGRLLDACSLPRDRR
jgi:hypothetical protein